MKKFFKGDSRRPMEANLKIKVELRGTLPYKPPRVPNEQTIKQSLMSTNDQQVAPQKKTWVTKIKVTEVDEERNHCGIKGQVQNTILFSFFFNSYGAHPRLDPYCA